MRKGIIISPYFGLNVGEEVFVKDTYIIFTPGVEIYRTEELSSFVVTTWDFDMLNECVKFVE